MTRGSAYKRRSTSRRGRSRKPPLGPKGPSTAIRTVKLLDLRSVAGRLFMRLWKILVGVSVVLTVVVGVLQFSSRISVLPTTPINPSDSFSVPFIVKNEGLLAIYDVKFSCHYDQIKDLNENTWTNASQVNVHRVREIGAGQQATVTCNKIRGDITFAHADMSIIVSFRPSFIPWRKEPLPVRFIVERGSDGQLYWLPQPEDKQS